MEKEMKNFFKELVEAPSPSGFEQAAQKVYRDFVTPYADEVTTDVHGNVIALKKGKGGLRFMIAGHADEIGLMITYIDDDGFLYFRGIGGVDVNVLPGLRLDIYNRAGKKIRGVIGKKAIHMMTGDEGKMKMENLWIDIGAKDKKDAEKRVAVGDYATFSKGMEVLNKDIITTKATDNKAGVYIAAAILKELANKEIDANYYAVSTVQEEVGLRGARTSAFGIDPHVAIAIDVTFTTDHPDTNKKIIGDIKLGAGPVVSRGCNINPKVFDLLEKAAKETKSKYQIEAAPRATGTDANALQVNRAGVATGLVSIPNRYMHTPNEVISLKDLDTTVKILVQFIQYLNEDVDFRP